MWINPKGLGAYLAKTWLPWFLMLCASGSLAWQSFTHRETCDARVAAAKTPALPPFDYDSASPWLPIGSGSVYIDNVDKTRLVHHTSVLPLQYPACLLRTTSVLYPVDETVLDLRQGVSSVAITRLEDCEDLIEMFGPVCSDPTALWCAPSNGDKPL